MDIFRTAYVYVRDNFAGELKETDEGYTIFSDKVTLPEKIHRQFH